MVHPTNSRQWNKRPNFLRERQATSFPVVWRCPCCSQSRYMFTLPLCSDHSPLFPDRCPYGAEATSSSKAWRHLGGRVKISPAGQFNHSLYTSRGGQGAHERKKAFLVNTRVPILSYLSMWNGLVMGLLVSNNKSRSTTTTPVVVSRQAIRLSDWFPAINGSITIQLAMFQCGKYPPYCCCPILDIAALNTQNSSYFQFLISLDISNAGTVSLILKGIIENRRHPAISRSTLLHWGR